MKPIDKLDLWFLDKIPRTYHQASVYWCIFDIKKKLNQLISSHNKLMKYVEAHKSLADRSPEEIE